MDTWGNQLVPELLLKLSDTLYIQYRYHEHTHEEVSFPKNCFWQSLSKQPFCMVFVISIVVFFIDHYCAEVSNKHCLFSFHSLQIQVLRKYCHKNIIKMFRKKIIGLCTVYMLERSILHFILTEKNLNHFILNITLLLYFFLVLYTPKPKKVSSLSEKENYKQKYLPTYPIFSGCNLNHTYLFCLTWF